MGEENIERVRANVRPREAGTGGEMETPLAPGPGRHVRCPVCEGAGEEIPGEGEERVCRCAGCRVLFRNPRPSIGRIRDLRKARFAGAVGRNHAAKRKADAVLAVEVMRRYHDVVSGKPAPLNAFGKRVLEIGCDLGFRLREFEKYGWTILGTETAPGALEYARSVMLDVSDSDPGTVPDRGTFHLILLHDVLAEVADPKDLAAGLPARLDRKGVVCVSVPEAGADDPALPEGAIWGFSEDALTRLFMPAGFSAPRTRIEDGRLLMWFGRK